MRERTVEIDGRDEQSDLADCEADEDGAEHRGSVAASLDNEARLAAVRCGCRPMRLPSDAGEMRAGGGGLDNGLDKQRSTG